MILINTHTQDANEEHAKFKTHAYLHERMKKKKMEHYKYCMHLERNESNNPHTLRTGAFQSVFDDKLCVCVCVCADCVCVCAC